MSNDNRISASLSSDDTNAILAAIALIHEKMPFLLSLSAQERRETAKMGDKSIGFDEKCTTFMKTHPEFIPGYVSAEEVQKDRDLRIQMLQINSKLTALQLDVADTLMVLSSEIWMADLAYYHSVREAARRNRAGAKNIYEELRQRFPGPGGGETTPPAPEPVPEKA